jgi:16S rRNA (guanine966-N2)-methyltransferase
VRPTAEPVRAALFDRLGDAVKDARVLDLFAGSGALGLEAISRGARSCDFVEFRPSSLHALKANVAALKLKVRTRIFARDALPLVAALAAGSYDLAFADPPYTSRLAARVLAAWQATRFSRILALEHAATLELAGGTDRLVFEETVVTIYR